MNNPTNGSVSRLPLTIEQINKLPEAKGWWPMSMNNRIIRLIRAVERAHGISADGVTASDDQTPGPKVP